jgi:uncharacterized membrane protein YgcG
VVIVPLNPLKTFGDLYEIRSAPNEIFVSAATVDDIEVIDALTQSSIRSQSDVSGLYPTAIGQGTSSQTSRGSTNTTGSSSFSGGGSTGGGSSSGGSFGGGGY